MAQSKYSEAYREQFLREALRSGRCRRIRGGARAWVMKRHGLPVAGQCAKIRAHDDGKPQRSKDFRAHDKLRVVVQASGLNDSQLGAFLREQGMHEEDPKR